jgi:hypothetical protein
MFQVGELGMLFTPLEPSSTLLHPALYNATLTFVDYDNKFLCSLVIGWI